MDKIKQMDKAVNTLVDLLDKHELNTLVREVNISIKPYRVKVIDHPTPTTYVWHMGHSENAYAGVRK